MDPGSIWALPGEMPNRLMIVNTVQAVSVFLAVLISKSSYSSVNLDFPFAPTHGPSAHNDFHHTTRRGRITGDLESSR